MREEFEQLRAVELLRLLGAADTEALETIRIEIFGRKGKLTSLMKQLGRVSEEERPEMGKLANVVKKELEAAFEEAETRLARSQSASKGMVDVTLPGRIPQRGKLHPISRVTWEVCNILERMGFEVVEGPDIETDYYNFESLNIPKDHPAREMQDTFYISDNLLLRTHTSPMQVRVMEKQRPPVRIVAPGKVYRRDSDVSHTPMFHQVEGLLVDKGVSFGDLKGVLIAFVHEMFGPDVGVRFRPSFFPFTEPSAEVDIQCVLCKGGGCRLCSQTGWLEILGSGMVDPNVYRFVDYDEEEISGFAFGMGVERIAMLKYGIDDIRLFFENDVRFLHQF
ncbi:MAG: phenylalanine--tRNA ligase subunit alpha [Deltaproteobacteria bacterium]|nr:phenylalanine--tRNA ligase subunit alpha [Deltaproteobacteria bacterium]